MDGNERTALAPAGRVRRTAVSATNAGRLPTFVVIGAMRSGTTSLTHWLRGHPEVHMAPQKEVHFFDLHFERGPDWYRSQFAAAGAAKAVGEATPAYMAKEEALDRMAALIPDAQLVALLRNPVDRAYSHYWHNRLLGKEARSFDDAIAAGAHGGPDYLGRGRYAEQLQQVEARFSRSALHVIIHDDLVADQDATFAALCRFLGIDADVPVDRLGRVVNAATTFRSLRVRRLTRRWPKPLRDAVGRANARPFRYPPLTVAQAAALEERMAGANAELGRWLGRDLSAWRRRAEASDHATG